MNTAMKEQLAVKRDNLREEAMRKIEKFKNNYSKLHKDNIDDADCIIGAIKQFFDGFTQPTRKKVKGAIILTISDERGSGVEYGLKAGGGSMSDNMFEAILKIDGVAIYKKYSTDFDKVLITEDEILGRLRPMVPTIQKVDNIVFNVSRMIADVARGRFEFDELDWELGNYDFVSSVELLVRIESRVNKNVEYERKASPTTREGCLEKYDWDWMDKARLPKIMARNKKRMEWIETMPEIFQRVKSLNT